MINFIKAILIGITMAISVGPLAVLCIRRSLKGHEEGIATALGIALADGFYAFIAALGTQAISNFLTKREYFFMAGGLLLIFLGVKALLQPPTLSQDTTQRARFLPTLLQTILLTITNPVTLFTFLAAFAAVGFDGPHTRTDAFFIASGVFCGSFFWFMLISGIISFLKKRVTPSLLKLLNTIAGLLLISFGTIFLVNAARELLYKIYSL